MKRITPNQYIRLQKKICNHEVISAAHELAANWGVTPAEACYRFLCEELIKDKKKKSDLFNSLSAFNK